MLKGPSLVNFSAHEYPLFPKENDHIRGNSRQRWCLVLALFTFSFAVLSYLVMSDSLQPHGLYCPWNSPGQNTGVDSLSLLQGIFPTQGLNQCLLHCRQILYQLRLKGNPSTLEWVAYPFSRGSSRPRNQIGISCIAGSFFAN